MVIPRNLRPKSPQLLIPIQLPTTELLIVLPCSSVNDSVSKKNRKMKEEVWKEASQKSASNAFKRLLGK